MASQQFPDVMPVERLLKIPAPYNPREILEHDFDQLKASLSEYGQVQDIVCNKRTVKRGFKKGTKPVIVGGHQRVRAAYDPGVEINALEVKWVDLTELKERKLNLILNRVIGAWEEDSLERALRVIEGLGGAEELGFTGFTKDEIEHYLGELDGTIAGEGENFGAPNEETNHECPKCGFVWNE